MRRRVSCRPIVLSIEGRVLPIIMCLKMGVKNSFKYMHFSQSLVIRIPERALGEWVVTSPVNIEKKPVISLMSYGSICCGGGELLLHAQ